MSQTNGEQQDGGSPGDGDVGKDPPVNALAITAEAHQRQLRQGLRQLVRTARRLLVRGLCARGAHGRPIEQLEITAGKEQVRQPGLR